MSFRFCDRWRWPAEGARVPTISTRAAAWPFLPATSDYGRPGPRDVGEDVSAWLRALLRRPAPFGRAGVAPDLEQLDGPFRGDRVDRIARPQARIGLAVGDVRAKAALLEHDRLLRDRILAQLLQRRRRGATTALARLGELRERLLQRDREHLLLAVERARLLA